tara:strand:- start:3851 stop:4825 length:975 start_codon:yes stop_codon:yes gene_type:complete
MRVFEIVEVDLGDLKLPDISKSTGPYTDAKTKIKIIPGPEGTYKLEYPDGKKETVKNKNALQNKIDTERHKFRILKNPSVKQRIMGVPYVDADGNLAKDDKGTPLKQKRSDRTRMQKLKEFLKNFFKANAFIRPLISVIEINQITYLVEKLVKSYGDHGCDRNHPRVKAIHIQIVDEINKAIGALVLAGASTAAMAAFVAKIAVPMAATGVGIIPSLIVIAGGTLLALFVGKLLSLTDVSMWAANYVADQWLTRTFIIKTAPVIGVEDVCNEETMKDWDKQTQIMLQERKTPNLKSIVKAAFKKDPEFGELYKKAKEQVKNKKT